MHSVQNNIAHQRVRENLFCALPCGLPCLYHTYTIYLPKHVTTSPRLWSPSSLVVCCAFNCGVRVGARDACLPLPPPRLIISLLAAVSFLRRRQKPALALLFSAGYSNLQRTSPLLTPTSFWLVAAPTLPHISV